MRDYDELKRKFNILLEENKALKARILELESKSEIIVFDHNSTFGGVNLRLQ